MTSRKPIRQGDVLLVPVSDAPKNTKPVPRDAGRVILAYGEVTGHCHAIVDEHAEMVEVVSNVVAQELYLMVYGDEVATLTHDEHAALTIDPGTYRVVYQREYVAPDIERRVTD